MFKYAVFSGPYFPVFGLNTEIYGDMLNKFYHPQTQKNPFDNKFVSVLDRKPMLLHRRKFSETTVTLQKPNINLLLQKRMSLLP